MGFLDKLFGRPADNQAPNINIYMTAETLDGQFPNYSGHNRLNTIWDSDLAWQCLDRIINEVAKITPSHVVRTTDQLYSVDDDIQRVLRRPNQLMTAFDMTSKVLYALYTRGDSWVFPVYEGTKLYSLNPVIPTGGVDWMESGGELFVRLKFTGGREYIVPYMAIIHIRKSYGEDEYMGTVRETPLLHNMQINEELLQGVKRGVNSSSLVNGVVKYGTALSRKLIEADVKAFSEDLKNNKSGILGLDNTTDYKEIKRDVKLVDADTLRYVQSLVLNHFGISEKILNGTASKEEEELWFHATIQPLMENLGQAYSRVLFSEAKHNKGHTIRWYSKDRLHWMSGTELVNAIKEGSQVGAFSINEIRDAFGYAPLTEEEGGNVRPMSLNFIDSRYAAEYQLNAQKKENKPNDQTKNE